MSNPDGGTAPTNTATGTSTFAPQVPPNNPVAVFDPAQLPAEVTERVRAQGDLINLAELTPAQIAEAKKIADGFNMADTAALLRFAADPQRKLSSYVDLLLADVKVRDAGIAGDMAKQLAYGIDLMKLDKVKNQIITGVGTSRFSRFMYWTGMWTNYIKNFFVMKMRITELTDKIEVKANNHIATLEGESKKLDGLTAQAIAQVRSLASWVLAGEVILIRAREAYRVRREKVLQTKDPVEASILRDMARQIARLEQRVLQVEIAYVKASSVTIPRVRSVQEGIVIEIQNTSEQVLFQLPDFKTGIVLVAALNRTKDARDDRKMMEENQRHLDEVLDDAINENERLSKESQGDALEQVQRLQKTIETIKLGVQNAIRYEADSRAKREQAHQLLIELKDVVPDVLKSADLESAARTG